MYTIGEVSKMFSLPISTIRYYDSQGFFPQLKRMSGIRTFSESDIESIRVTECLKASGLTIREIKCFFDMVRQGDSTYSQRKEIFINRKIALEKQMKTLEKTLAMLKFKIWYYEKAMQDGNEDEINKMLPNNLPKDIQEYYDNAHK